MKEWVTGRNPVYEVLRAGRRNSFRLLVSRNADMKGRLAEVIKLAGQARLRVETVDRELLDRLDENHQGVALETSAYPYSTLQDILQLATQRREPGFILALDLIQNPQNLGVLLRTAESVGVHGVLIPLARSAGVTPAVVHASAGASEHLLLATVNLAQALDQLKKAGYWVIGLEAGPDSRAPEELDLSGDLVLVVGNEGKGLRALIRRSCDQLVAFPARGMVESLNAAAAGSIALYLAWQARSRK